MLHPAKSKKAKPKGLQCALVVGCTHEPYVDVHFWLALCDFAKRLRPDVFHRNGDIFDFYGISRFSQNPEREGKMLEEREVFFQHESWMQAALPRRTHRIAVEGNHEDRVFKFLLRASQGEGRKLWTELGMARPTWDEFLQLDKFGYDVRCAEGVRLPRVLYGDLAVWHGERANKYAVAHNVMRMGNNACNHTHRARAWAARVGGKNMYGYELGYAADARLATDYIADEEDWQQAFGVVWFDDVTGYFDVDVVMVHEIRGTARRQFNYMSDRWEWTP